LSAERLSGQADVVDQHDRQHNHDRKARHQDQNQIPPQAIDLVGLCRDLHCVP
jgi:hypothetical protein